MRPPFIPCGFVLSSITKKGEIEVQSNLACVAPSMCCFAFIDAQQKSLLLMMLLHVCRTRIARLPWKIISHPSSMSSVKGNLGGQVWLTQVPCLVRRDP